MPTTAPAPVTSHLHAADSPELVQAPRATFVSVLGSGRPGTDAFYRKKILVADVASALPAALQAGGDPRVVEILYWYPQDEAPVEIADFYTVNSIDILEYRVLARVDDATTPDDIAAARRAAASTAETAEDDLVLFTLPERPVVQVMHHGPFAGELDTLARLGAFAQTHGVHRNGAHHEIHLDPFTATTPQDDLRTILRDPVA
jgi:hypothetical protein